jgi:hypothetical protein
MVGQVDAFHHWTILIADGGRYKANRCTIRALKPNTHRKGAKDAKLTQRKANYCLFPTFPSFLCEPFATLRLCGGF